MNWLTLTSLVASIVSLAVALLAWRRMGALEHKARHESPPPSGAPSQTFQATLLKFESMLEELDRKSQEAIARIESRERELLQTRSRAEINAGDRAAGTPHAAEKECDSRPDKFESLGNSGWAGKTKAILRLAEEGHDATAIAQRLGLGKGEVQLVLDIRKTAK